MYTMETLGAGAAAAVAAQNPYAIMSIDEVLDADASLASYLLTTFGFDKAEGEDEYDDSYKAPAEAFSVDFSVLAAKGFKAEAYMRLKALKVLKHVPAAAPGAAAASKGKGKK